MLRRTLVALTFALARSSPSQSAQPQRFCGERAEILAQLSERYDERPRALGILADGGLLEVAVSPKGSWTILVSYPKGPSCVMAVGRGWRQKMVLAGQPI